MTVKNGALSIGAPPACDSNVACSYSIAAGGTSAVYVTSVRFLFRNLATGVSISSYLNFSGATNIAPGGGGSAFFHDVNFNDLQAAFPTLKFINNTGITCGGGIGLQVEAIALQTNSSGTPTGDTLTSCDPTLPNNCATTEVSLEPCICTQISDVFTTLDSFDCISIDGSIGIQGKLFEVTCGGGIISPFIDQTNAVHIGLQDPATGVFFDFIPGAATDGTGTFGIAFSPKQRTDFLALVPNAGSKTFNLLAFYEGTQVANGFQPSNTFSKPVTISGPQGPMPCSLGTLVKDTIYAFSDPTKETHTIQSGFAGGLVIGGVTFTFEDLATEATNKIHDAIVSAGAVPIEIKVYRGPDISLPAFYGFVGVPVASFNVVATAQGSPVAGIVIAAAIIAVIIILLFFIFLIFTVVKDILGTPGGATTLVIGGIVILAGIGLGAYILTRPSVRRRLS